MDENRYIVGIDIGTDNVKVIMGSTTLSPEGGAGEPELTIIGVGSKKNAGMRKGVVIDINKVADSLAGALDDAEVMSGQHVESAKVSINGSHIEGVSSRGVIAVGGQQQIGPAEVDRVIDAATIVKLAPNRVILNVKPRTYRVDGQDGVRDPIDMSGVRLEVDSYVITALMPHLKNLEQVLEKCAVGPLKPYTPAGLAASDITLADQQKENGSLSLDIGHSTTTMVVYEDGDVIDIKVLPVGSNNITKDLAIGLRIDLDVAERLKLEHGVATHELRRGNEPTVALRFGGGKVDRKVEFPTETVDEIIEARLAELFELVNKELRRIKRQANLPGGVVLSGGGSKLRGIADYARSSLEMNARVFKLRGIKSVTDKIKDPSFAAVIGLVSEGAQSASLAPASIPHKKSLLGGLGDKLGSLFSRSGK